MSERSARIGFVDHDGIRFAREGTGHGRPLVLLHGLGGDRQGALELADEAAGWQRFAIDQRGHGETEPVGPEAAFTFATLASDTHAILRSIGSPPAVIAGVSMGAGVALRFALDHPESVRALILVRPAWTHVPMTDNLRPYVEIARLLRSMSADQAVVAFEASAAYRQMRSVSFHAAATLTSQFTRPKAVQRAARLDRMPRSVPYERPEDLAALHLPVLVVGCDRDPLHPIEFAETWSRLIPGAALELVASSADDVARHRAEVRRAVAAALARLGGGQTEAGRNASGGEHA